MVDYNDFVYKAVKDGAIGKGALATLAEQEALSARGSYQRNQFRTPTDLIKKHIDNAIKATKKAQEAAK
jgi:hypothetical protein